jgi:multifunctional methyltransferase subunit TRM112
MRLIHHNTLRCPAKDINLGYPLLLTVEEMEVIKTECNYEFIKGVLPSLHWQGVVVAAEAIGLAGIPQEWNAELLNDDEFLEAMHDLLLDVRIVKGVLKCPETGKCFPVENGIPNMNLTEGEV